MHPEHYTGDNYDAGGSEIFTYPKDTNPGLPHYIRFIAKKTNSTSTQNPNGIANGEVVLYMPPDALKTSYSQSIGDVDLGGAISLVGGGKDVNIIQGALERGARGELTATGVTELLTSGTKIGTDNAKAALLTKLQSGLGPLAAGISKATGKIINPHKAVVYQGPGGFRTFSYTFILVPKSADEAKEIFNIVKFFKKRMHPGTGAAGINNVSSITLTYPDEFEIKYYVNKKEVDGSDYTKPLFKIHNCFMESFTTDYTTSSLVSFMDDNQPLTTTISMSFKETQLLTKVDIDAGY